MCIFFFYFLFIAYLPIHGPCLRVITKCSEQHVRTNSVCQSSASLCVFLYTLLRIQNFLIGREDSSGCSDAKYDLGLSFLNFVVRPISLDTAVVSTCNGMELDNFRHILKNKHVKQMSRRSTFSMYILSILV